MQWIKNEKSKQWKLCENFLSWCQTKTNTIAVRICRPWEIPHFCCDDGKEKQRSCQPFEVIFMMEAGILII